MHQNKYFLTKVKNLGSVTCLWGKDERNLKYVGNANKNEEEFESWLIDENHNLQSEALPFNAKIHLKNKTTR